MSNPYDALPPRNFWRSAVGSLNPFDIADLYVPKFRVDFSDSFATAGSCFAQHISRAIAAKGIKWIDAEPAPPRLSVSDRKKFNYGVFSFRTSNIYTTPLLHQWLSWSLGETPCPDDEDGIWTSGDRYIDPFRPAIEPGGFETAAELVASRKRTLRAIKQAVTEASVFVFTLGLTEAWASKKSGIVFAACPGTLGGEYSAEKHEFRNLDYLETRDNLVKSIALMRQLNPDLKIILTVSPVPLTATAEGHVLVSTTYSKSVLRAVAGDVARKDDKVDYFPSYEIISAAPYRGIFFEQNMRSVNAHGVEHVMKQFLGAYGLLNDDQPQRPRTAPAVEALDASKQDDELVCEEAVLEFYNGADR